MKEWAKREVELACKRENPNRKEGEFDYGCACYESALKAFNSLCEDGHSGFSIGLTKHILNRLIEGKPLTPINDTDDGWNLICEDNNGTKRYQNKRMSSLFKYVHPNGVVTYSDVNRVICTDINNPDMSYHNSFITSMINDMYPISMPYMPFDKAFEVYTDDFLTNPKNGDYDTKGVLYVIKPDGERVNIERYFKDSDTADGFDEIDREEYEHRRRVAYKRIKSEK